MTASKGFNAFMFHAVVILFAFVMFYPVLWMLVSSFRADLNILADMSLWPGKMTLDNYIKGWSGFSGASFAIFFKNSFFIVAISIIGNVMSCSLTAYPFARMDFPLKKLFFGIMLMTIMIPEHVLLIPQYIMFNKFEWINTYLPLLVPRFFAVNAFFIYLMIQFIRSLPKELDHAATVDGCNRFQIYTRLILPMSMPVLVTAMIFTTISTWNDFLHPLIYISEVKKFTVSLGLSLFITSGEGKSEYSQLFAMSMLSLIPLFTVFVFFQRYLVDGVASSGIK
ncbi:carbohydrate ABC transporter permease [Paenibacillus thalictri]|uniref:Carbohydrate ABC transporter permease n=1 Tax=Paenibacillus thalictri TaxID=2527873 RepID=A0A4Q9DNQ2_9BACL|nr:carbohydrate ABC transporter permease [Paenibacillus thalictri]TBL75672.1 carbohydrate ABC transporter permease [Paenibacillus thalictri]